MPGNVDCGSQEAMIVIASVERSENARQVVTEASRLGEAFGGSVRIVHVVSQSELLELELEEFGDAGGGVPLDEVRERGAAFAAEQAGEPEVSHEYVGLIGDPATKVTEYAETIDASYIVTAGRNRSRTGDVVIGRTAQDIILNSPCRVVLTVE